MRTVTLKLEDGDFARLAEEAERRGRSMEDLIRELAVEGLIRRAEAAGEARQFFDRLLAEPLGLSEDEALELARSELAAMRAERRAPGRP